jgi:dTDP-4-amino-4,6-dideoxygalactose transaminase
MSKMVVPFLDLKAQYASLREDIDAAIHKVLDHAAFAGGPFVAAFEEEFARFCGVPHAVGVGSGTDALWLALLALGIGRGDEVITVPNTFIATAEAITYAGAHPVFVDVDDKTYNMDPSKIAAAITPRTRAIIPVHLFGQMADMDPIMDIAREHGLAVIEDASQAHGAEYKGRSAGSIGDVGCFSFYPGKNLGAYGEAGGIVTSNNDIAQVLRMLRDHGQARKYIHQYIGWNARMDGIQGAVLSVKIKKLRQANERRREHAKLYDDLLRDVPEIRTPHEAPHGRHVYHIYAIRAKDRDLLIQSMAERSITCGIHYPVPLHLQGAYSYLNLGPGAYPVAEAGASEFVSLPMYPELSREQIEYVAHELVDAIRSTAEVRLV